MGLISGCFAGPRRQFGHVSGAPPDSFLLFSPAPDLEQLQLFPHLGNQHMSEYCTFTGSLTYARILSRLMRLGLWELLQQQIRPRWSHLAAATAAAAAAVAATQKNSYSTKSPCSIGNCLPACTHARARALPRTLGLFRVRESSRDRGKKKDPTENFFNGRETAAAAAVERPMEP